jgi:hypothetical protein
VCKGPGYCQKHNVNKTQRWFELCQTDAKYFAAWEAGRGPGQGLAELTPVHLMRDRVRFVKCHELAAAAVQLASRLPDNVSRIVAIPRSGLIPASIIATLLHLPLYVLRQDGEIPLGGGSRTGWGALQPRTGIPAYIDDTMHGGYTFRRYLSSGMIAPNAALAVCYIRKNLSLPVLYSEVLPYPHLLEWNIFNAPWIHAWGVDMDGVVCKNPPYQHQPLYPIHNDRCQAIITARPESERATTVAWLEKWRMQYNRLIMWSGSEHDRWNPDKVATWKARICHRIECVTFIESEPDIAVRMRRYGIKVLCPSQGYME